MNNSIIVEPSRLEETASRIEEANLDYERLYQNLYSEVDKLSGSWGGKEHITFTNKIKSYEDDFKQISISMKQYDDFLRASARAYSETQDELASAANRLKE